MHAQLVHGVRVCVCVSVSVCVRVCECVIVAVMLIVKHVMAFPNYRYLNVK